MSSYQNWRELLGKIIKDPQERLRLAGELGVSSVTLTRWVNGESKPRPYNLRLLVDILPEQRPQMVELIREEFGDTFTDAVDIESISQEIPSSFYMRILSAHCNLPKVVHFHSICDMVLSQALKQLDPHAIGMEITIVLCVPPTKENKIRSLRETMGRGTGIWGRELEQRTLFLGAESLTGYVATTGHARVIQSRTEGRYLFPAQWVKDEESAAVYPIMRAGLIAGCLLVSCTQPDYFVSIERQTLLQYYTDLLTLAFEPEFFYSLEAIELRRMPPYELQLPFLTDFRQRVADIMLKARVSVGQAERLAWQRIEEELLRLSP